MPPWLPQRNEQLEALHKAFDKACVELGLGYAESDSKRREQLAQTMLSLAENGKRDADVVGAKAVHQMRPPPAGLFHQI